jgi:NhaP-type Na+/H+ or K+/H+ antiporter
MLDMIMAALLLIIGIILLIFVLVSVVVHGIIIPILSYIDEIRWRRRRKNKCK